MQFGLSSGNAPDSICPKGWRLPGYEGNGSWRELFKPYSSRSNNTNSTNAGTIVYISPLNLLRAGYFNYSSGNLNGQASEGYYYSSKRQLYAGAHNLYLSTSFLYPSNDGRDVNMSIRCLARYIDFFTYV